MIISRHSDRQQASEAITDEYGLFTSSSLKFWPEEPQETFAGAKLQTTWLCHYPTKFSLLEPFRLVAFDAINHIDDSNDSSEIQSQWNRNSMFTFHPFDVLGVAFAAQTSVNKQRPTKMSPTWTVFNVLHTVNNQPCPRLAD